MFSDSSREESASLVSQVGSSQHMFIDSSREESAHV